MKTLRELADHLGLKQKTMRFYVYKGYINAEKIGHIYVVSDDEFNRVVEKYRVKRAENNDTGAPE